MSLGEKLKAIRKNRHNLTLSEVAGKTNLSVSFLSDVERGRTKPSLATLETLANFYAVNISELVDEQEKKPLADNDLLPQGLKDLLLEDPNIDRDIIDVMVLMEHRAKKKPVSKEEWLSYYHSLKWMMGK
ncbi:MAG: XRE family transcriptional regulator [Anaerolineaceae bacterium]|jgi:transcriptional regulator with XRE-family HTH domain|nr:MAG: XRE family transcriptional regulator [Anaerolineaceae bacterium]